MDERQPDLGFPGEPTMTSSSSVSVVIPVHNAEETIAESIRSILEQTVHPDEIVVVDDGSTDNTAAILAGFGNALTCIRQTNGGLASARHAGIAAAKGDLIALMDADDICEPNRLAVQVEYLSRFPDVVFCATDFSSFDAYGRNSERYAHIYYDELKHGARDIFPCQETFDLPDQESMLELQGQSLVTYRGSVYDRIALGNFMHPPTAMFRRDIVELAGNFNREIESQADWEWIIRAARTGNFGFIAHPLLKYRRSETQISSERNWVSRCIGIDRIYRLAIAADPDLYRRQRKAFDQRMRDNWIDTAYAYAETSGLQSLSWLVRTMVTYRHLSPLMGKILVKALLPGWGLALIKKAKGRIRNPA
jgi:glycosyltransferase involved in cell wall biosynthesis